MTSILFVCLGNICRSPMAQGALEQWARRSGRSDLIVASAGTAGYHIGEAPDRRAQAIAREFGVDISMQTAAQLAPEDFYRYGHIVCMDRQNLAAAQRICPPDATAQLSLLLSHGAGGHGEEVPDPYYGGDDGFHRVWTMINDAVEGLMKRVDADARRS
ncbi:MAG: low molecular weight protein-tyrosine-phosphatase [Rhodothalassiaceae bacterium]